MCSRFELSAPAARIAARFGLRMAPIMPNKQEIRPTDVALVIGPDGAQIQNWGLSVDWDPRPLINARMETWREKPTFRRLLTQRVIVPASAWWEWDAAKVKMRLHRRDDVLMGFAGLTDGARFVVVTRPAIDVLSQIHDRMPALADQDWLTRGELPEPGQDFVAQRDQAPPRQPDLFG